MTKNTIIRASQIIFANEGNYSSVNADDNGALSVGRLQWHGTRALELLRRIVEEIGADMSVRYLDHELYTEIITAKSWSTRTVNQHEAQRLKDILSTSASAKVQDDQAETDVTVYLLHVETLGVTEENAQIFMADIENQGGAGASARIIENANGFDMDSLYLSAINDVVFKNYIPRRRKVYSILMGHAYGEEPYQGETHIVAKGDTLSKIALKYVVSIDDIAKLNNISNPNMIRIGETIKIPQKAQTEKGFEAQINIKATKNTIELRYGEQKIVIPIGGNDGI